MKSNEKTILVVDDEPHIRDLLDRSLTRERYTVDLAEDGEEAWRKVKDRSYDCVITDLKMPGMGGQQFYRLIKGLDRGLAQKVIFITGDTISSDSRQFISEVDNPVLTKPFLMSELRQQISQVLDVPSGEG